MSKKPVSRPISLKCDAWVWMKRPAAGDTSCRYWRNYISFFFDLDVKRLLYGVEGRDRDTVSAFADDLSAHGGDSEQIRQVCCDMWPAYISGVKTFFPNAEITFDRFHIIKIMNQAVDEVRRQEAKTTEALKKTRYLWLKNPANLSDKQRLKMDSLAAHNLKTARAYQIRLLKASNTTAR
jgi:transposase